MKAYAYVRVSGKGQVQGDGFRRQEDAIRAFSKEARIAIEGVYREEGVSGTTTEDDRPAFQEMVTAILKNGVRTIVIESMDRLARELMIQESLLIYLASKGITLIVARTGENVTEAVMGDPMRKALVQMQGVFAELEKNLLVKKLRVARERVKKETGKCEGRKSIKELDADLLRKIKLLRRGKPGQKQLSFTKIAERLNQDGHTTVSGKPFTGYNIQKILQRF